MVPSGQLLKKLRALMQLPTYGNIEAYIVPSEDAHQSEYSANCYQRRAFISKFTGSCGTAVITLEKAALWTDGRYHLQASNQLDPTYWTLMKDGLTETPTIADWLKDVLKVGSKVGVDSTLISFDRYKDLSKKLRTKDITLIDVPQNLIDIIWDDRPKLPCEKIIKLDTDITGKDLVTKVKELRQELEKKKVGSVVLTNLDDIAWLWNLRGSDVDCNPVFYSYCIVTLKEIALFIDREKFTPEVEQSILSKDSNIEQLGVKILQYNSIIDYITNHLVPSENKPIWVSNTSSAAIVLGIPKKQRFIMGSPVTKQKSVKNDVEIKNIKNCHIRDAAALCEYLAWLEKTLEANPDGHDSLKECSAADYLENYRKQQDHFMGLSFPTISASGPNGAIIHYSPKRETQRPITKNELYLVDSGGQYLDGTTDITRTVHFGTPSSKERECFTLVLKGHIMLAKAIFPRLTKGSRLDSFARHFLWSQGLDYLHGTGHGVGMFLNVHEGPTNISPRDGPNDQGIEAGQILSNEPGYYENGAFGIRIENLVVSRKSETRYNFQDKGYLEFETISLVPIQSKMIDLSLMTDSELEWLNNYHAECRHLVGDHLEKLGKHDVKQWLIRETKELKRQ